MPEVRVAFLSKIDDADGYRDFAQRATAMVREEDPGTLVYNWFVSEDGTTVINEDVYDSSESFLAHLGNMTKHGFVDEFMQRCDVQAVRVLGEVDDAAREALGGFGAQHFEIVQSL